MVLDYIQYLAGKLVIEFIGVRISKVPLALCDAHSFILPLVKQCF